MTLLSQIIAIWLLLNAVFFWWMADGRFRFAALARRVRLGGRMTLRIGLGNVAAGRTGEGCENSH